MVITFGCKKDKGESASRIPEGKCVVLRRRIGKRWHENEDADYKVVFAADSLKDCRRWMEDDIYNMASKWPELVKHGPPTWSSDQHHLRTELAFMGTPDFFVDYMASVPRAEFGNRAFLDFPTELKELR